MTTKSMFFLEYDRALRNMYDWTQNETKMNKFMLSCHNTIHGTINSWNHDGDAVKAAWKIIGMKGRPTLKGLRALED